MKAIALFSILLTFGMIGCNFAGEQEMIVVPRNFKGYIIVFLDQKDGKPMKYSGSKRVYEVPQNGILKTQFKYNEGWKEAPEYYYERIAPENKLRSYVRLEDVPIDTIVGFMGAGGTIKKSEHSDDRLEFSLFFIGTKSEIEEAKEKVEKLDFVKLSE